MKNLFLSFVISVIVGVSGTTHSSPKLGTGLTHRGSVTIFGPSVNGRAKRKSRTSSSSRSRSNWSSSSRKKSKQRIQASTRKKQSKAKRKAKIRTAKKAVVKKRSTKKLKKKHSNKTKKTLSSKIKQVQKLKAENKALKKLADKKSNTTNTHTTIRGIRNNYYESDRSSGGHSSIGLRRDSYGVNSYGGFNGRWLISELMAVNFNRRLWHSMYHTPGYGSMLSGFRSQASQSGDQEILDKLDNLESTIASMEAENIEAAPIAEVIEEAGVPVEVALDSDLLIEESNSVPVLKVGTGKKAGMYFPKCNEISEILSNTMDFKCAETVGSEYNIQQFCVGAFDAIFTQSDTLATALETMSRCDLTEHYQTISHDEVTFLFANKSTKGKSIKDIKKGSVIYVGPKGSGTAKAWEKMVSQDSKRYGNDRFKIRYQEYSAAMQSGSDHEGTFMFYVGAVDSPFIKKIDQTDLYRILAVNDWDFDDAKDSNGDRIYNRVKMPMLYTNLQAEIKSFDTLALSAVFMVNKSLGEDYGEEVIDNIITAVEINRGEDYNLD